MVKETDLTCTCGNVMLQIQGDPLLSVECLCSDCQAAGAFLQSLPFAPNVLSGNGATPFVMYRKDRVRCARGADHLREHRLTEQSKTRRVVATCCNTPMFLEFTNGHWLSIYGGLWQPDNRPPLEMRTMTKDTPDDAALTDDMPNPKTHTAGFFAKLIGAWVAMGFRTPKIDYVKGRLNEP